MMESRRLVLVGLLLVSLTAPAGTAEDGEGSAPPWSYSPCDATGELCADVGELYLAAYEMAHASPADGVPGIVASLAALRPTTNGVWVLHRGTSEVADEPMEVEPGAMVTRTPGGPAMPVIVVPAAPAADNAEAPGGTALPAPRPHADPLLDALAPDAAFLAANGALAALPVDPRATVVDLIADLGTLTLPGLLGDRVAVPPPATAAPPPQLREAVPGGPADLAAPPLASVRHEDLTTEAYPLGAPAVPGSPGPVARAGDAPLQAAGPRSEAGPGRDLLVTAAAMLGALLLIPPLYHRLHQHQLLEHAARAELYRLVTERPGVHIEELARLTRCSRSTVVYHLRLLSRHGYVVAMDGRKSVHYYPNTGGADPGDRERRALLTSPRARALAGRIGAQPGVQRALLAEQEGISVSTLSWHLGRLLRSGLVEDRVGAAGRELHPGPELEALLRPWATAPGSGMPRGMPPADAAPAAPAATPS